jgi:hypothetical protein
MIILSIRLYTCVNQLPEHARGIICNLFGLFFECKKFPEPVFAKALYKPEQETKCAEKKTDGKCVGYPGIDVAELQNGQHNKVEHKVAKQYGNESSLYAFKFGCFINAFVECVHNCGVNLLQFENGFLK